MITLSGPPHRHVCEHGFITYRKMVSCHTLVTWSQPGGRFCLFIFMTFFNSPQICRFFRGWEFSWSELEVLVRHSGRVSALTFKSHHSRPLTPGRTPDTVGVFTILVGFERARQRLRERESEMAVNSRARWMVQNEFGKEREGSLWLLSP